MRFVRLLAVAGLAVIPCVVMAQTKRNTSAATPTTIFGRNLLKNGNAEVETNDSKKVPGWEAVEGLTVAKYGSVSGEWDWDLPGCSGCGKYYLRLQFEGTIHELATSQTVDVSSGAADIDHKPVTASVSAYLGGFRDSDKTGTVIASFQDGSGKELGTVETKPYDTKELPKAERGSTGLVQCQASAQVPVGTRKIIFTWKGKSTGESSDYLALGDNFSLVLTLPPPAEKQ